MGYRRGSVENPQTWASSPHIAQLNGIRYRAQSIKTLCGIDVQTPSAFVSTQGW